MEQYYLNNKIIYGVMIYTIHIMVLIIVKIRTCCPQMKKNRSFRRRKKIRFVTALDLISGLDRKRRLLLACVPIYELPTNNSATIYMITFSFI